ncbi:hypothetical protein [Pseudomonas veronii]|uniref:hypothetical protein n=1 Tax=Pseudomonas veronii TaxID=76761 RepID=UPI001680AF17|nr:hypothetical protein [Pseudomonas veronii]
MVLTVQALNWLLDGFDLWHNRAHQILTPRYVACPGIIRTMISLPNDFPDDPVLLKQLLFEALSRQEEIAQAIKPTS